MKQTIGKPIFSIILLTAAYFLLIVSTPAQIQIGTIRGAIADENGAAIPNADVRSTNAVSSFESRANTNENGEFTFNNLSLADYSLEIAASGFAANNLSAEVRSNIPFSVQIKLRVAGTNAIVEVAESGELTDKFSTSTEIRIDESRIERAANKLRGSGWQRLVATIAGAATQNNGLIHIRGVDNGLLYVVDGVPTADRVDAVSASSFDTDDIRSFNIRRAQRHDNSNSVEIGNRRKVVRRFFNRSRQLSHQRCRGNFRR